MASNPKPLLPQFLVFDTAIIPVQYITSIRFSEGTVRINSRDATWLELPCTADRWTELTAAFTEGV